MTQINNNTTETTAKSDQVIIFDTTLRDGEQSPGASMTKQEKLQIAKTLEQLQVDVIEAGFAIASKSDFDAIHEISKSIKNSTVCSLARSLDKDIEQAAAAIAPATNSRIHTFIATSPIHMQYKLRMSEDQVLEQALYAIKKAKNLCSEVEFSCEDAARSEFDFLCRIIEQAIDAGASVINIPDTVGYAVPAQFSELIQKLIANIPNADKAIFSVHCHNDLGLAVANSLAAVNAGARQVECTINGLGERAGNCSLEEVVMALRTRHNYFNCHTNIATQHIVPASRLVSQITGFAVQPNKAIVGANAFAHESGIHQDGVLKHRQTYEVMQAKDVGWHNNSLVLGKHSGRHALLQKLKDNSISYDEQDFDAIFKRFKALADKKHQIYDADLISLVDATNPVVGIYKFSDIDLTGNKKNGYQVKIDLLVNDKLHTSNASGNGPVNAAFAAIDTIIKHGAELVLYSVNSITEGIKSQGVVTVRLSKNSQIINGTGSHTDIIIASIMAYINAINDLQSINNPITTI